MDEPGFTNDVLDLPGIRTTARRSEGDRLVFEAETIAPVFKDCHCDAASRRVVRDGRRERRLTLKDAPRGLRPVVIEMLVRKGRCTRCGTRGFGEIIPHIAAGRRMTRRLHAFLSCEGLGGTNTATGRRARIPEGTVRSVVGATIAAENAAHRRVTPRVLGIDSTTIGRERRAVLANLEERTILDILPDDGDALDAFLAALPDRETVEVLVTDMHASCARLGRHLPGATHVVDRFHVAMRANRAMHRIRAAVARTLPPGEGRLLNLAWKGFGSREAKLEGEAAERVARWNRRLPVLGEAYRAKEGYLRMYDECRTPGEAARRYDDWMASLTPAIRPCFARLCRIPEAWRGAVFAYFEHRYTNGFVEGTHALIRAVERAGRGHDFGTLRGKVLFAPVLERRRFEDPEAGNWNPPGLRLPAVEFRLGLDVELLTGMLAHGWIDRTGGGYVAGRDTIARLAAGPPALPSIPSHRPVTG